MAAETVQLEEETWEEKKRTREIVSTLMGQYLLKGYRMLSITCTECESILLQTRDGTDYCVYCSEVVEAPAPAERDEVSGVTGEMGSGSQVSPISTPPFSVTSFPATKTPASKMASGGSGRASEHRVPIVCTGRTRDTTKLTTTPAADHDTMKMCTDTKRTGMRTNPTITHSVGLPGTPPPDRAAKTTSEVPPSPARKRQKVPSVALPQTVYTELGTQCQAELIAKLKWCTSKLEKSHSLEESILLCRLIAAAGEALKAMRELSLSSPTTDHSNDT